MRRCFQQKHWPTLVASRELMAVPEGVDDAVAAALGNAGLAAWLPRQAHRLPGETVLVLGATGIASQLAVQAAKALGAGRVIAAGRNEERLRRAQELGADATVNCRICQWYLPRCCRVCSLLTP
jgi:NADPH:quinone reductase-like Zn-dependent oxidoreductase